MEPEAKEPVEKLKRPTINSKQIRKFEYKDKSSVIQFDVKFPDVIDRTYVVRLNDGFTDDDFETAIETERAEAKKQKALHEAAEAEVQAKLDKIYPEKEM